RQAHEELGLDVSELTLLETKFQPKAKYENPWPLVKHGVKYDGQLHTFVLFKIDKEKAPTDLSQTNGEFVQCEWKSWDELLVCGVPSKLIMYNSLRNEIEQVIKRTIQL